MVQTATQLLGGESEPRFIILEMHKVIYTLAKENLWILTAYKFTANWAGSIDSPFIM